MTRSARRSAAVFLGGLLALGAGVQLLHAPRAGWLGAVLRGETCPLSGVSGDRQQRERHRRATLQALRGRDVATGSPALGFELGATTREQAVAWLERHGGCCRADGASALSCEGVLSPGELAIDSLRLELDPGDRVVAVDLFRSAGSARAALDQLARTEQAVARRVGVVTRRSGTPEPAYIEAGALRRVAVDFRYSSYMASLSAMNFGGGNIRVRESYHSLPAQTL